MFVKRHTETVVRERGGRERHTDRQTETEKEKRKGNEFVKKPVIIFFVSSENSKKH